MSFIKDGEWKILNDTRYSDNTSGKERIGISWQS